MRRLTRKGTREAVCRLTAGMAIAWSLAACEGLLGFASFEDPARGDPVDSEGGLAVLDSGATLEGSDGANAGPPDGDASASDATGDAYLRPSPCSGVADSGPIVCITFESLPIKNESPGPAVTSATGVGLVQGQPGLDQAGLFDGGSLGLSSDQRFQSDKITIDAWLRPSAVAKASIFEISGYLAMQLNAANQLVCRHGTIAIAAATTTATLQPGVWTHVACVFEGTATGYVDGVPRASAGPVAPGTVTPGALVTVGSGITTKFDGQMDEVRYFVRAMEQTEIAAAATPPKP
ncbi:MAG: LamG domain-containing protein [Myxococcales bacterium]|nr:LamG domain-containing protein [Myxococcales bacterium]